ncbi:hypothetical protein Tco_0606701 [Tanacetum coccineum]
MSDSEDSTVTYMAVSSPFGGMSDIGSLGVDGPPVMTEDPYAYVVAAFQAPSSPDYVPGPEEPEQALLSPEFFPEPVYLEFMSPEDDVLPAEEHPLLAAVSPTTDSPRYIADSDPEEDEEDPKEGPIDYPADRGDDDDDDNESSDDYKDDDDDVEEDEEEEEHTAPADSVPPPIPSPPLPQIPSPPLPISSPVPVSPPLLPASPTYPLGYRVAMIRQRAESPSTSHLLPLPPPIILLHTRASVAMMRASEPSTYILAPRLETPLSGTPPLLPIPLPTPSPPLLLPSTDCRAGVFEVTLPPRKRLGIALGPRYEVGESSSAPRPTGGFRTDYGFVATLDDEIRRDLKRYVGYGITNTWDDMYTDEIYVRLDDAQDDRSLMSGQLNMLFRDRRAHAHTALLMEREARLSCEAWRRSMDASDVARYMVMALRTTVLAQQVEIEALRTADRIRQAQLMETLRLVSSLQTQVTAFQRQHGPARGPTQPEIPEEGRVESLVASGG